MHTDSSQRPAPASNHIVSTPPHTPQRAASWRPGAHTWRCAALIFFLLLLALGAIPGKAEALSAAVNDKLLHFTAYVILSTLLYGGMPGHLMPRACRTLCAVGLLGVIDEGLQALLPYRTASAFDWQVDLLAAAVAVITLSVLSALRITHPASDLR